MNAFGRWMVKSNLLRIEEEGLDVQDVVSVLRANGYDDVAQGVLDATNAKT